MAQLSRGFQLPEGIPHPVQHFRLDVQAVVGREDPLHRQPGDPLHGRQIGRRVGGGIVGEEDVLINQVAGEEISGLPLEKAHMARRMSGGMQHLQRPPAQVDGIPVPQDAGGAALEHGVVFNAEILRRLAAVQHHLPDGLYGQREFAVQPVQLRLVGVKIRVTGVAADVVPVDVGGHGCHRETGQLVHLVRNMADAQAGVDEQTALCAAEQVAVGLLPVAVLADDIGITVYFIGGKPVFHKTPYTPFASFHFIRP